MDSTTTTTTSSSSSSLWSKLRRSSHSTLSERETENLRKLKEEIQKNISTRLVSKEELKRDKTARLRSSSSSGSLTSGSSFTNASSLLSSTSSSSLEDLSDMMNTGRIGVPSLRIAPVEQRVYVA